MILPASSSPFSWEDVAPAWRWSLQVRTWHHRLQRKCCRKGVCQNIQRNRILVPSKYPTEYHHCWQRNYVRYIFFFWESFNFFVLPLPKTGQSGGCGCGAGTWLPLYCAALEHRIVPPAATCSVVAQSGGEVLLLYSTERNWAAGKRKVGRRERRLPPCVGPRLCSPPAEMLPAQLSAAHQVLLKSRQMGNLSKNQQGAKRKQFSLLSRFFDGQDLTNLMFLKNAHYKRLQPKILTLLKMELRRACDVNGSV